MEQLPSLSYDSPSEPFYPPSQSFRPVSLTPEEEESYPLRTANSATSEFNFKDLEDVAQEGEEVKQKLRRMGSKAKEGGHDKARGCWSACTGKRQLLFLGLLFFQACLVLACIALVYETIANAIGNEDAIKTAFTEQPRLETVATYVSLFILAVIFEVVISFEALLQQNIMQLALLIPLQMCMVIYSSFLPSQLHKAIYETKADTPLAQLKVRIFGFLIVGVIALSTLMMVGAVYLLKEVFGWAVVRSLSADLKLKRMYTRYQLLLCLLKFDMFFFVGFAIQFTVLVSGSPLAERVITIAAIPLILIFLVLAAVALRYENKWGMYCFLVGQIAGLLYFVYKLYRIYTQGERYDMVKMTLTIFSCISIVMLVGTFVVSCLCIRNFGEGLKHKIPPYWSKDVKSSTHSRVMNIED